MATDFKCAVASLLNDVEKMVGEHEKLNLENAHLKQQLQSRGIRTAQNIGVVDCGSSGHLQLDSETLSPLTRRAFRFEIHHKAMPASEAQADSLEQPTETNGARKSRRRLEANGKQLKDGHATYFGDIQDAIKTNLTNAKEYNVKDRYYKTGFAQTIARHYLFEHITIGVIALNAIWMAVDTDYNDAAVISDAPTVIVVIEQLFTFYFFFELLIRFASFEHKIACLFESWFMFDFVLVTLMVTENWILTLSFYVLATDPQSGSVSNILSNASILRVARLLRLSRLFRMMRLMRSFPEFLIIVRAIATAARSVGFTLGLLLFVMYTYGIAFTQLLDGTRSGSLYFPTVLMAMNTLAVRGAISDSPGDIIAAFLKEESYAALCLYYTFLILTNITIMNMLTGVLCSVISAVAEGEKEFLQKNWIRGVLQEALYDEDQNDDGRVQRHEFFSLFQNKDAVEALQQAGIDTSSLPELADVFFENQGEDDDPSIQFDEFVKLMFQLRSNNFATVKDLTDLRKWIALRLAMRRSLTGKLEDEGQLEFHMHQNCEAKVSTIKVSPIQKVSREPRFCKI